jgi:hypothetical protein
MNKGCHELGNLKNDTTNLFLNHGKEDVLHLPSLKKRKEKRAIL